VTREKEEEKGKEKRKEGKKGDFTIFVPEYIRQFTQKGTVTVCFLLVSVGCSVIYPIARKHESTSASHEK